LGRQGNFEFPVADPRKGNFYHLIWPPVNHIVASGGSQHGLYLVHSASEKGEAVIQPGGSIKDEEVIAAANEHGIAMIFTGMRHFRH
jgi:hypothetical protein